jgi:hypothetical protein
MGRIKKDKNKITVIWPFEEVLFSKAYVSLPTSEPPEDGMVWYNSIGTFIMNGAEKILKDKGIWKEHKQRKISAGFDKKLKVYSFFIEFEEEI